jgi:hypothetical protein
MISVYERGTTLSQIRIMLMMISRFGYDHRQFSRQEELGWRNKARGIKL